MYQVTEEIIETASAVTQAHVRRMAVDKAIKMATDQMEENQPYCVNIRVKKTLNPLYGPRGENSVRFDAQVEVYAIDTSKKYTPNGMSQWANGLYNWLSGLGFFN